MLVYGFCNYDPDLLPVDELLCHASPNLVAQSKTILSMHQLSQQVVLAVDPRTRTIWDSFVVLEAQRRFRAIFVVALAAGTCVTVILRTSCRRLARLHRETTCYLELG